MDSGSRQFPAGPTGSIRIEYGNIGTELYSILLWIKNSINLQMCRSFLFDQRKVFETVEVYISKVSFILYCTFSLNAPPSTKTGQPSGQPFSLLAFWAEWMSWVGTSMWVGPWNWKRFAESYTECLSGTTKGKEVWPEKIELGLTKLFQKKT